MDIYAYQRLVGKIQDISELRDEFISVYDTKSQPEVVRFCQVLGRHLLDTTGFEASDEIQASFEAMQEWLNGTTNYHKARNLSFAISRTARDEKDSIKIKFLRTMAQIAASPHVKYHGLWATDFAIALVNIMYPDDMSKVKREREKQVELVKVV